MQNTTITWVGCDVSKSKFNVALRLPYEPLKASQTTQVSIEEFPLSKGGVGAFANWSSYLRSKVDVSSEPMHLVMEATGRYSRKLFELLHEEMPSLRISIENTRKTARYMQSLSNTNKTDTLDAKALMQYGLERNPKVYRQRPVDYMQLRELTRQRAVLDEQLVAARLRLQELEGFKDILKIQEKVVKALEKSIDETEKLIKNCVAQSIDIKEAIEYATSIDGVGFITATTVLAECGPLQWHSSRELSSYSGLAPKLRQSGSSINSSRISRAGAARLRRVLYMASIVVTKKKSPLTETYNRLKEQGRKPMQARCAIMRKLLVLIRAVVVNRTVYDKDYKKNDFCQKTA